jgi:hypothetical protein
MEQCRSEHQLGTVARLLVTKEVLSRYMNEIKRGGSERFVKVLIGKGDVRILTVKARFIMSVIPSVEVDLQQQRE